MFNPESLDLSTLPSVLLKNRLMLPKISGIYFAMSNGTVQYIGRSTNLYQRWAAHHRYSDLHPDSHIAWIEISNVHLLPEIEKALIAWFKPQLNGKQFFRVNENAIETKTKQVAIGKRPTITILPSDLAYLKQAKQEEESLYITLHRLLAIAKEAQTDA